MKVYRYGLLAPTTNAVLVREQMVAAHHYRNKLTEIERERRAALRAAATAVDDISVLETAARDADTRVEEAARAVKAMRSDSRSRSETEPMRQQLRDARAAKSTAVAALREARRVAREDPAMKAVHDGINERSAEMQRAARASCGVYWGSYLLIEAAAQDARKAPLYDGAEPSDPRFSRWMGEGRLGVQVQNGMDVDEIFNGEDTRIRIDPVPETAWLHETPRGERRRQSRTTLRLRVGSDGRLPIWADFPMVMHRGLPKGARIKAATVTLRKRGPREEWSCEITVDDAASPRVAVAGTGAVAIDIGWRVIGEDLRVAVWRGEDGETGEVRLDARLLSSLTKASSLRSIRDTNFNSARDALKAWLTDGTWQLPEWLVEQTSHLHQWRSPARLAGLARRWKTARFPGDEAVYAALESWRYHDHHLWHWESSQRIKSLRRRRELYRVVAADLSARYHTLVIEQFDLRRLARRAPTEATPENDTARSNRQLAAVSELRLVLVQAFVSRGGEEWRAPAAHTTVDCSACGKRNTFDAAEHLRHQCTHCGVTWDQDENATVNLLERWHEEKRVRAEAAAAPAVVAPPKESRWARAQRLRREREDRKGGGSSPAA